MKKTNTTSPKKVTFSDAKVGDKVWSFIHGWGTITERFTLHTQYPLHVEFDIETKRTYTLWGLYNVTDHNPTLFWDEVKFDAPEKPMPALEVDAKVLVWMDGSITRYSRHFSHFENNNIYVFDKGLSSWTGNFTSPWDHWELSE